MSKAKESLRESLEDAETIIEILGHADECANWPTHRLIAGLTVAVAATLVLYTKEGKEQETLDATCGMIESAVKFIARSRQKQISALQ